MPETSADRQTQIAILVSVLRDSQIGALIINDDGNIAYVNSALCAQSGYGADELLGRHALWPSFGMLAHPQNAAIASALAAGQGWQGEIVLQHKSGRLYLASMEITPLALTAGGAGGALALMHTVRESEPGDERPALDSCDRLTGLPSATSFSQALRDGVAQARQATRSLSVARIDIDRFDELNQTLGRAGADKLLIEIARRLQASIRQGDLLARLAGDSFLLLLAEPPLLDRILSKAREPIDIDGRRLVATVSIGAASFPANGDTAVDLLAAADAAVGQAKGEGRDCCRQAANPPAAGPGDQQGSLLADLRMAVEHDELVLHYQPQLNLLSGEIVGVEALLRWVHPQRGLIAPLAFIPLAEENGLIAPITEWVLARACEQAVAWRAAGLPRLRVGVNLSARHFRFLNLKQTIDAALQASGLDPACLELELTESVMMHDVASAMRTVDALKGLGVRLALDDFGTGYSSLAHLSRFAIDSLKVDKSFITDVTSNAANASIVAATVAMAHKLGKSVIAEGVETAGQMHFLRRHGCDEIQGFLFAPALPAADFEARLARGDRLEVQDAKVRVASASRLLLVDDEPSILTSLHRLLRREGYEILTAGSGAEGLEVLARERVQVIVSDQRMPGMSGTEFLRYAKAIYPHSVRLVLSGYADLGAVTEAINQGAIYKYLSKPWDDEALKNELREAFRHGRTLSGDAHAAEEAAPTAS